MKYKIGDVVVYIDDIECMVINIDNQCYNLVSIYRDNIIFNNVSECDITNKKPFTRITTREYFTRDDVTSNITSINDEIFNYITEFGIRGMHDDGSVLFNLTNIEHFVNNIFKHSFSRLSYDVDIDNNTITITPSFFDTIEFEYNINSIIRIRKLKMLQNDIE